MTVNGRTRGENIARAEVFHPDVIRPLDKAIYAEGATAVLKGNLAPRGAVMKPSAAEPRLRQHRGKAVVFRDYNHMAAEIERDDLDVTPDHVLVLQNAGPKGGPGMPEWGMLPIPRKLVRAGVRDMLRISDGRMSGHQLRRLHPARGAGELRRRSARAGEDRRRDRGGRRTAPAAPARLGRGAGQRGQHGWRRRRATSAATAACSRNISAKPTTAATSISWSTARRCRSRRSTEAVDWRW